MLSDAAENINLSAFRKSNEDFTQFESGTWWVEKKILHGGKQEGVEIIVVNNGKLELGVSPTRGMSVIYLKYVDQEDYAIGWRSPVTEVVHPQFIDLESRGGLGWLDGFNEWMCRCGLEFAGHPGKDAFTTYTGEEGELTLTLHGKVGNIPASSTEFSIDQDYPHRLRIRGTVFERSFHGPKLRLDTEISTAPGSLSVQITDRVTNEGANDQEFQLMYHTNYGAPILEEGARVVGAFEALQPMNDHAAKSVNNWNVYEAPSKDFVEQVYLARATGDEAGKTSILLENRQATRGVSITWDVNQLPYVAVWKNTASMEDGYVTGLEPATGFPFNRWLERQFDRVPKLHANQTRDFSLSFDIHPDPQSVRSIRTRIKEIQKRRPMSVTSTPPIVPEFDTQDK